MVVFAGTSTTVAADWRGFSHIRSHFPRRFRGFISDLPRTCQQASATLHTFLYYKKYICVDSLVWIRSIRPYLSQNSPPRRGNNAQNPSGSQSTSSQWESRTAPVSLLWLPYKQTETKTKLAFNAHRLDLSLISTHFEYIQVLINLQIILWPFEIKQTESFVTAVICKQVIP